MATSDEKSADPTVKAAFGAKNRVRLIDKYFEDRKASTPDTAWEHVYRLLLWIDPTTGLAHCYESDKSQPGKNWYGRSLAFHDWVSSALRTSPSGLVDEIDWLFQRATADLAAEVLRKADAQVVAAARQRKPYGDRGFPQPGEDPELVSIVKDVLGGHLSSEVTPAQWQELVQRLRQYLMLENKRRNLVGEGFEDALAAVIQRAPGAATLDVRTRCPLNELPGFNQTQQGAKPAIVDLAILGRATSKRTLVTVKWSVRSDRERQLTSDFADYIKAKSDMQPFDYVFVTNEFDPARLMRACEILSTNTPLFTNVVHVNTDALIATYGASDEASTSPKASMSRVVDHIRSGRLIDLKKWLGLLLPNP